MTRYITNPNENTHVHVDKHGFLVQPYYIYFNHVYWKFRSDAVSFNNKKKISVWKIYIHVHVSYN